MCGTLPFEMSIYIFKQKFSDWICLYEALIRMCEGDNSEKVGYLVRLVIFSQCVIYGRFGKFSEC